jgi:peroxiredoxin
MAMSSVRRERQVMRQGGQPRGRSAVRVIEAILWLVVVGLFAWRVTPQLQAAVGWRAGGTAAPAVTLDMLDGQPLMLHQLKGQVVLVNFWATWCPPCRAELPGLESVYEAKHADGFTIVGVSMDEASRAQVAAFLQQHGIQYPIAMATPDVVTAFGGINSFPTSFLLDRQGRVRYTVHGMFATPTLRAAVNRLLAERS